MQNIAPLKNDLISKSEVALRTFFNITNLWALSPEQQKTLLGIQDCNTLGKQCDSSLIEPLDTETMVRTSYVLGIYNRLNTLLPIPSYADGWLKKPNSEKLFNGNSALDFLIEDPKNHLPVLLAYLRTNAVDF